MFQPADKALNAHNEKTKSGLSYIYCSRRLACCSRALKIS